VRIALVHHQFGGGGGLEKYLLGFAQALDGDGHSLQVITSRVVEPLPQLADCSIHKIQRIKGLRSLQLLNFDRASAAKARKVEPELTLGFGQTGGGCHRVYSETLPPWKRYAIKNQIELDLERRLYTSGATQHFVVNATKVSQQLQENYGVSPERITVIHTPVDTELYRPWSESQDPPRTKLRETIAGSSDLPVCLFVSLNHRRKGLDALLDIWKDIEAELWIVGEPLSSAYQEKIQAEELNKRVHYLGKRKDLPQLYRAADLFLHPTLYDACANTVLQSMASGLPGIISSSDGAVDFIEDGQTGFLLKDPTDREELRHLIQSALAKSDEDRSAIAAKARERMMVQTWAKHLQDWQPLFERYAHKK